MAAKPAPPSNGKISRCLLRIIGDQYRNSATARDTVIGATETDGVTRYWIREVSADGKRKRAMAYNDEQRTKLSDVMFFDRVK